MIMIEIKNQKMLKNKGSTIEWGIKNAIKNSKKPPDIIYHKGDMGKEPMIIVFAQTPDSVMKKILKNYLEQKDKFILEHKYSNLK